MEYGEKKKTRTKRAIEELRPIRQQRQLPKIGQRERRRKKQAEKSEAKPEIAPAGLIRPRAVNNQYHQETKEKKKEKTGRRSGTGPKIRSMQRDTVTDSRGERIKDQKPTRG